MSQLLSNWRSVRLWEQDVQRELHLRHRLWLHGWIIGLLVLAFMWIVAFVQMALGESSLTLRYAVTLGAGYAGYLVVIRMWAAWLLKRDKRFDPGFDLPGSGSGSGSASAGPAPLPRVEAGGGGDFGGGGASADFSGAGDGASVVGEVAQTAAGAAAGSGEGAVVIVPVVAIFLIGLAVLFGAGSLLMLYFGWEALLTAAVELAFSYVSARTAIRVAREGWLQAVVRLTWKPLLGALLCAVLLGATIDFFLPSARSLPQALHLVRASLSR
jgi:hypothetical protein